MRPMVKEGKRGLDVSRVRNCLRGLARQMYGGPNSMLQFYKDEGAAVWWVDGWGHGGIFVGVWDAEKTSLTLRPECRETAWYARSRCFFDGRDYREGPVLTAYVYEEDCEWSKFAIDNPNTHRSFIAKGTWARTAKADPEKAERLIADLPGQAQRTFDCWYAKKESA